LSRDFVGALLQLNAEKGVSREQLVRTVEEAIESAYRRVSPGNENVHVEIDPESGKVRIYRAKTVVEEVEDPQTQFTVDEAKAIQSGAKVGDLVEFEQMDNQTFGRIHAQTAKQVVLQRLREAEREVVFGQYAQREGEIITGTVNRVEPRAIILDVGRGVEAVLATTEQSANEHYRIGQHVKAYVLEVRRTTKGPQIYVSRTHKGFLRRLFELEVPEIHAGTVEIRAIAREAGSRSKVAVGSRQEGLDPVGATVGQRGGRVQAVVAELSGEKIDVIPHSEDPAVMVANALSPAQVVNVNIDEESRVATVTVPERMLSLAIGREGQNARLAAKLTGWRIDIRSDQAASPRAAPGGRDGEATNGRTPRTASASAGAKATEDAPEAAAETAAETAEVASTALEAGANGESGDGSAPAATAPESAPEQVASTDTAIDDASVPTAADGAPEITAGAGENGAGAAAAGARTKRTKTAATATTAKASKTAKTAKASKTDTAAQPESDLVAAGTGAKRPARNRKSTTIEESA
jgi:N utilization substance protein A